MTHRRNKLTAIRLVLPFARRHTYHNTRQPRECLEVLRRHIAARIQGTIESSSHPTWQLKCSSFLFRTLFSIQ